MRKKTSKRSTAHGDPTGVMGRQGRRKGTQHLGGAVRVGGNARAGAVALQVVDYARGGLVAVAMDPGTALRIAADLTRFASEVTGVTGAPCGACGETGCHGGAACAVRLREREQAAATLRADAGRGRVACGECDAPGGELRCGGCGVARCGACLVAFGKVSPLRLCFDCTDKRMQADAALVVACGRDGAMRAVEVVS